MPVIREKRQYQSVRPVGVVRMDTGEQRKYAGIAEAAKTLTGLAVNEMGRQAEIAAEQSAQEIASSRITTINPKTGKPEALDWIGDNRFFGRKAANAYARVVSDRFQKEIDDQIKQRAGEIALQYEDDPYSVEKYEEQMTAFLEGMAKGSEENGKKTAYTNYILDQGTQYITSTKLSMMQERNRRERNKLQASIVAKNAENLEMAFNFGLEGRDIADFIEASVDRNLDGEASALLKPGASIAHSNALETAYVNGSINRIFQGLKGRPADRARVELAIRTGNITLVPESLREDVGEILPYVDTQNRTSILGQASALSQDYSVVERNEIELSKRLKQQLADSTKKYYEADVDAVGGASRLNITQAFNSKDGAQVIGAIEAASEAINDRIRDFENKVSSGVLKQSDADSFIAELRQSTLEPVLAVAAMDKPEAIEDFRRSILTGFPDDNLSDFQRQIVDAMNEGVSFYDRRDDQSFANEFLNKIKDPDKISLRLYNQKMSMDADIDEWSENALQGNISESERVQLQLAIINSEQNSSWKDASLSRLKINAARGYINSAVGATSRGMNALGLYVRSNGKEDLGLPPLLKSAADNILSEVTAQNKDTILQDINARESALRTEEAAQEQARKETEEQIELQLAVKYGGVAKTPKLRRAADQAVIALGIDDITSPQSETQEFYQIARNTMPQMLLNSANSLAEGNTEFTPEQSNTILNHVVRLSNDPSPEGKRMVNRFGDLLGANYAILKDAAAIREFDKSRSVTQIIADLRAATSGSTAMLNYEDVLGSKQKDAAYKFAFNMFDDRLIANEVAPIVSYYAKTGKTESAIKELVRDYVDANYVESEYIVDPSMPAGSISKSKFSLSKVFPTDAERTEFLKLVQQNLPEGYSIIGTARPRGQEVISPRYISSEDKRVYLAPYDNTGVPQYYTYYVDPNTGALEALIFEKDGEDFWPMFDGNLTKEWRESQEAKAFEESQNVATKRRGFLGGVATKIGEGALFGQGTGIGRMR